MTSRNELIDRLAGFTKQLADIEAEVNEKAKPHEDALDALNNEYGEMTKLLTQAIDESRAQIREVMIESGDKRAEWAGLEVLVQERKSSVVENLGALWDYIDESGLTWQYANLDIAKIKRELGIHLPGIVEVVKPTLVVKPILVVKPK